MTNPALEEFQFELEGYVFGRGCPVFVDKDGLQVGDAEPVTQDSQNSQNGTRMAGRDFYAARTLTFGAHVDGTDVDSALAIQEDVEAVWRGTLEGLDVGEHVALRYKVGGRSRRVFGRPRRFAGTPNNEILSGHIAPSFTFDMVDANFYDDDEQSVGMRLISVNDGSGAVAPFEFPLEFIIGDDPDGTSRDTITVGGRAPTAPIIEFDGPVANPEIWVAGRLLVGLTGSVPDGSTFIIDARPWANTIVNQAGVSQSGLLSARTWLSRVRLKPGKQSLVFKGRDDTGRAAARVRWRNAHYSL